MVSHDSIIEQGLLGNNPPLPHICLCMKIIFPYPVRLPEIFCREATHPPPHWYTLHPLTFSPLTCSLLIPPKINYNYRLRE